MNGESKCREIPMKLNCILGIETAGSICSAAVVSQDKTVLSEHNMNTGNDHEKHLMPLIEKTLSDCKLKISDVSGIAVSTGPGSFTGLRIGIATAKGLALASGKPLAGIPTLDGLSYNITGLALDSSRNTVCPMLDARRGEVYSALYKYSGTFPFEKLTPYMVLPLEEFLEKITEKTIFLGDFNREIIEKTLGDKAIFAPPELNQLKAVSIACLGLFYTTDLISKLSPAILSHLNLPRTEVRNDRIRKKGGTNAAAEDTQNINSYAFDIKQIYLTKARTEENQVSKSHPVFSEINLEAARQNLALVKQRVGKDVSVIAVVKSDAYSHGAVELAGAFLKGGAEFLAVANVEEGIKLRSSGIAPAPVSHGTISRTENRDNVNSPIIILNPILAEEAGKVTEYELTPVIDNLSIAELLNRKAEKDKKCEFTEPRHSCGSRNLKTKVKVHIEVDTGMGRGGFLQDDVVTKLSKMKRLKNIIIEGIFTHFPSAEDKDFTMSQITKFKQVLLKLERAGINIPYKHSANSKAMLNYPESFFNMVRPGLCLYGISPSPATNRSIRLNPVLTLKSRIIHIREVPAGLPLCYDRTYTTTRKTIVGTLPVGYYYGYDRRLSNKADVLVRGKRCPVIGRICMDRCLIDLTDIPDAMEGDEVILIGKQTHPRKSGNSTSKNRESRDLESEESISVEELAEKAGTIPHEFISRIHVPRIYA